MKLGSSEYEIEIVSWLLWLFLSVCLKIPLPIFQKHCLRLFPDRQVGSEQSPDEIQGPNQQIPAFLLSSSPQVSLTSLLLFQFFFIFTLCHFRQCFVKQNKAYCSWYFLSSLALQTSLLWLVKVMPLVTWCREGFNFILLYSRKPAQCSETAGIYSSKPRL